MAQLSGRYCADFGHDLLASVGGGGDGSSIFLNKTQRQCDIIQDNVTPLYLSVANTFRCHINVQSIQLLTFKLSPLLRVFASFKQHG